MTSYCVGCDNILGGESNIINKVAKVLEKEGNTCQRLSVGPNYVQSKGKEASSKGKVAVFLVGGSDLGTYVDFMIGMRSGGYYHYKYIWFAFASWTASTWITCKELKTRGLVRAHDDNFSKESDLAPWKGKSADYFFSKQSNMGYVCGNSPEELAKKILSGGNSGGDSKSKRVSEGGTIKDALQKLLTFWDGQVECYIRGNEVHVNKVRDPEKYHSCTLKEGTNVFADSVSLTDVNPNTCNYLEVVWTGGTITIKDDNLIKRFGVVKTTVYA